MIDLWFNLIKCRILLNSILCYLIRLLLLILSSRLIWIIYFLNCLLFLVIVFLILFYNLFRLSINLEIISLLLIILFFFLLIHNLLILIDSFLISRILIIIHILNDNIFLIINLDLSFWVQWIMRHDFGWDHEVAISFGQYVVQTALSDDTIFNSIIYIVIFILLYLYVRCWLSLLRIISLVNQI